MRRQPGSGLRVVGRIVVSAVVLAGAVVGQGRAQQVSQPAERPTSRAVLSADEITYDDESGIVIADGNVEIAHGERLLLADRVRYDQSVDSIVASGNVTILEPDGDVIFADYVELSDELREGVIENIRILLLDNSRFAANGARRIGGRRTIMRRGVFSSCDVCPGDESQPPLWQLKAGTIVHDQESQDVSYTNAWLEFAGVPVLYTPYLTHPDPTVERRSGLLTPLLGSSTEFGGFARVPVFWAITPSVDVTFEPILATKKPSVMALEFRQHVDSGVYELSGSVTQADRETGDPLNPVVEPDVWRGHLFGTGRFDINDNWRWGFDVERASDRSYLDQYDFFGQPENVLTTNPYVEGYFGRSYVDGNAFVYQDVRGPFAVEQPLVLPDIDYEFVGEADSIGGRWSFDMNGRTTSRDSGPNTRRLIVKGGYFIPTQTNFGLLTTFSASVRADGYHMDKVVIDGVEENNVQEGRVIPRLAVESRLPFVRGTGGVRQLIEPAVAVVLAPGTGNPTAIPEEDSVAIELDDTNLFSEDRIPGDDRIDTGQRIVYGLKGGLYGERGGRLIAFFGQSYRWSEDDPLALASDIEEGYSDYVGRLEIVPNRYMDLLYRFRLSEANFEPLRNELGLTIGPPALRLTGDYVFIASEASAGAFPDREQVTAELSSQLTDFWSVSARTRRDLTSDGGPLEYDGRITYEDECFRFDTIYRRQFTESVGVDPGTRISFQFVFKSLGDETAQEVEFR